MSENEVREIKKIATKNVVDGDMRKLRGFQYRLKGLVNGVKTGVTQYGEWTGFTGLFQAERPDGVKIRARQAFIHDYSLTDELKAALAKAKEEGDGEVRFAFDVHLIDEAKSPTGYSHMYCPILDVKQVRAFNALDEMVVPALPESTTANGATEEPADEAANAKKVGKTKKK